jgi:predicted O-methyltransferase YrrM
MIYKNIQGWFLEEEANALYQLTSETSGSILEIGHFYGRSTSVICEALKEKNKKNQFVSYDLGFASSEDVRQFYSKVMYYDQDTGLVPELYKESFDKKITTTEIARENLKKYNLDSYVKLISGNFIDLDKDKHTLIFCDATHDAKEIEINLPHIIARSEPGTIWAFHDLNAKTVKCVTMLSNSKFLYKEKSLGIFEFLG